MYGRHDLSSAEVCDNIFLLIYVNLTENGIIVVDITVVWWTQCVPLPPLGCHALLCVLGNNALHVHNVYVYNESNGSRLTNNYHTHTAPSVRYYMYRYLHQGIIYVAQNQTYIKHKRTQTITNSHSNAKLFFFWGGGDGSYPLQKYSSKNYFRLWILAEVNTLLLIFVVVVERYLCQRF